MSVRRLLPVLAAGLAPAPACAHAVGERYDLPLPVELYILGGALTVALSFAVVALVVRTHRASPSAYPPHSVRGPTRPLGIASAALQAIGLALFVLAIAAGLLGEQHPARNLATTLVWIVWWIGLAFVAAFVVDPWPHLNPWRTIARLAAPVAARLGLARAPRRYPRRWQHWPAVILLLAFVWFELVYPSPSHPRSIAVAALAYSLVTLAGMAVFGRETWLRHGEAFTVFFATLGRFAPIRWQGGRLRFGLWGAGLARPKPLAASMVAFILLMLAAVLFDGFLGTGLWRMIERSVRSLLPYGADPDSVLAATLALAGLWLAFVAAYNLASRAMARLAGGGAGSRAIAGRFALSLVPIGVGYNLAHNLSYLLVQGQAIAALLSDPFGAGWNLFGTAHWQPEIGVIDAGAVWIVALFAIVGGHLVSVYLAHLAALQLFARRGAALRALVPMTILMVLYTGVSLTVIAEPLVRFRKPDPSYTGHAPLPSLAAVLDWSAKR